MSRKEVKKVLRLREIRIERGLTQDELAKIVNVNRVTIAEYESNRVQPTLDKIIKMSIALEVTPNDLLGYFKKYSDFTEYLMSLKEKGD